MIAKTWVLTDPTVIFMLLVIYEKLNICWSLNEMPITMIKENVPLYK